MEPKGIVSIPQESADSGLSVDRYFKEHAVPFSRHQYFRYKAWFAREGVEGLFDGRSRGNHRKLTPDAEGFIRGVHHANPRQSLGDICETLRVALGIQVDQSTVSRFLRGVESQSNGRELWNRKQPSRLTVGLRLSGRWRCIWDGGNDR